MERVNALSAGSTALGGYQETAGSGGKRKAVKVGESTARPARRQNDAPAGRSGARDAEGSVPYGAVMGGQPISGGGRKRARDAEGGVPYGAVMRGRGTPRAASPT